MNAPARARMSSVQLHCCCRELNSFFARQYALPDDQSWISRNLIGTSRNLMGAS